MVEKQSTQNDETCHEMGKVEDEEIIEDGLGWPYDWAKGCVQPGRGGDNGQNYVPIFGANGERV